MVGELGDSIGPCGIEIIRAGFVRALDWLDSIGPCGIEIRRQTTSCYKRNGDSIGPCGIEIAFIQHVQRITLVIQLDLVELKLLHL